jgi:predicted ATPase
MILGEVRRGRHLIDESVARSIEAAHVPTLANSYSVRAEYEIFLGDVDAVLLAGKLAFEYSREHELGHYLPMAKIRLGWAHARLGEHEPNLTEMRQALTDHIEHGNRAWVPLFQGLLADIEAEVEGADRALGRIDEALALARETGERWTDAFLHRIRGNILLKRYSADPSSAEEAFITAITVAQQQKAKSFELRAALSLAKLYQSSGRAADAQAVLAPALEGFSPTPEFPEIVEGQELLATLETLN